MVLSKADKKKVALYGTLGGVLILIVGIGGGFLLDEDKTIIETDEVIVEKVIDVPTEEAKVLYKQDYLDILASYPERNMFILGFDPDKVEVLTRTDSEECEFGVWRIDHEELTVKCGTRVALKADWLFEYYKTYGPDEWVRLNRKATQIKLSVETKEGQVRIVKTTPYYATASRSGTAGNLKEIYTLEGDQLKLDIEFDATEAREKYKFRPIWRLKQVGDEVEISDYNVKFTFDTGINWEKAKDDIDRYDRTNDLFYFKGKRGDFSYDPTIYMGALNAATSGVFNFGWCTNCANKHTVTLLDGEINGTFYSGWLDAGGNAEWMNMTSVCTGQGVCRFAVRTAQNLLPTNGTTAIFIASYNLTNQSTNAQTSFNTTEIFYDFGAFQDDYGIVINGTQTLHIGGNNFSSTNGTIEIWFEPEWSS